VAHAADQSQFVSFEAHAWAASVTESPSSQFVRHLLDTDRQAGGQPFDDDT
jgi:hypothetical protein